MKPQPHVTLVISTKRPAFLLAMLCSVLFRRYWKQNIVSCYPSLLGSGSPTEDD
jgi:hypothetical protein